MFRFNHHHQGAYYLSFAKVTAVFYWTILRHLFLVTTVTIAKLK